MSDEPKNVVVMAVVVCLAIVVANLWMGMAPVAEPTLPGST